MPLAATSFLRFYHLGSRTCPEATFVCESGRNAPGPNAADKIGRHRVMNYLGIPSENTVMVGDRMDTDIVAGVVSGLETYLVLSGVTASDAVARFPYRPTKIFESVAFIDP
jgi:hypothetical protein